MELAIVLLLSVLPVLVIAAGLNDLTTMTIPNWISLGLMIAFVPAALSVGLLFVRLMYRTSSKMGMGS